MRIVGRLGAAWGMAGVFGLLLFAIYRLTPIALAAFEDGLSGFQWAVAVAFTLWMIWSEGVHGFQRRFSPRTAARIRYLRDRPDVVRSLLAPLFTMGFFHSNRRTKIVAYGTTLGVVTLVVLVQGLAQPWRGIVDSGVVIGLSWGIVSLAASTARALTASSYEPSPEVS